MIEHAGEKPDNRQVDDARVPGAREKLTETRVLDVYDATALIGLKILVRDAAIERIDDGDEVTIELPKLSELAASAAIARCLIPIRLRGLEIKAMRHIMKMTMAELAKALDEKTAAETVSRWESEAQPMGGYAEKILRLVVCERLTRDAPGISYNAGMIANLRVLDPWRVKPDYEVPYISLSLVKVKREQSGEVIEAWDAAKMAA